MATLGVLASVGLILLFLVEGFEAMVLPRRVTRPYRMTRLYYRFTWRLWRGAALRIRPPKLRQSFLSWFGPLSILGLFATWIAGLILSFALLQTALDTPVNVLGSQQVRGDFWVYLYLSGVTFFTCGFGDVTPVPGTGRFLTVLEAGVGFGFMAVIIGYLPVLFQAFSQRETTIALLDARAGSPPTAGQLLLRLAQARHVAAVDPLLAEWEQWSARLLESHLSFPLLSYYRSQHDNQSWLAALTAILDTCALLMVGVEGADPYQARLTFATSRHALVDLALVFGTPPRSPDPDRLPMGQLRQLRETLCAAGLVMRDGKASWERLEELRGLYEPFANALARYFLFDLPSVWTDKPEIDNWQTSAWMRRAPGIVGLSPPPVADDHFE
jgi:hypothetical protein